MDWALIAATVFFGLTVKALWANYRGARKGRCEKRQVGYRREEIHINAANVPVFKPTWRDMRRKGKDG